MQAPALGSTAVPQQQLTEEVLSKLSLPPAVLRKAQQLPGVIPLPNGQEVPPASPPFRGGFALSSSHMLLFLVYLLLEVSGLTYSTACNSDLSSRVIVTCGAGTCTTQQLTKDSLSSRIISACRGIGLLKPKCQQLSEIRQCTRHTPSMPVRVQAHVLCNPQIQLVGRALLLPGVEDRVVVIRDDEPTSLVAFALSTQCVLRSTFFCC
jgi:hypothetical protein